MFSRIKEFFQQPLYQGFAFFVITIGLYYGLFAPDQKLNEIEIQDNLAFLAHGEAGVLIVDITNPDNIVETASYDTLAYVNRLELREKNIYVANGIGGLLVLDHSDPNNIEFSASFNTPGIAEDLALYKKQAFIADGNNGLVVVNIDDLENLHIPPGYEHYNPPGYLHRIVIQNNRAYIADRNGRVRIVNISDPKSPQEIGLIDAGAIVNDIVIQGKEAFLAASENGIMVFNIEDPAQPQPLGTFDSPGIAKALTLSGLHAYLADGPSGLRYADLTHLDQIAEIGKYENISDAVDLVVKENLVYLADADNGLKVVELDYNIEASLLTPETQPSNSVDVAVSDQVAYIANQSNGIRIISVSNPLSPKEIGLYDTPGLAEAVSVSGDLILVADKNEGLRILSASTSTPEKIVLTEKSNYKGPGQTIGLAADKNFVYLANGNGGLRVINIENPDEPREVGFEDQINNALSVAILEDHAYVADSSDGLRVVNILDPAIPTLVGTYDTPGEATAVAVKKVAEPVFKILVYVADGGSGLRVIDATDPENPIEVGYNEQPDFVKDVVLIENDDRDLAHVADRTNGLWVMDITVPENPEEIGFLETPGEARAVDAAAQNVYIAAFDHGLRVVDAANPTQPKEVGAFDKPKHIVNVLVDQHAYLVDQNRGLQIMDVSKPQSPKEIGFFDANALSKGLALADEFAYMGVTDNLKILNVSDPTKPVEVSSFGIPSNVTAVDVSGDHAFVANIDNGLRIVEIKDPSQPKSAGTYSPPGNALDVTVDDIYAFTAQGDGGVQAINVANPESPRGLDNVNEYLPAQAILVVGEFGYVANDKQGIGIINVSRPPDLKPINSLDTPGTALGLAEAENHLFVADGSGGIQVFYILNRSNPLLVGTLEVPGGSVALDVVPQKQAVEKPGHFYVYSAGTDPGLQILNAEKTTQFNDLGFYPSPITYGLMLYNLMIFFLSLSLWIFLSTALFFPVESWEDRWTYWGRILQYGMSLLGAGSLIREGKRVSAIKSTSLNGSPKDLGQGFVMVDPSSAAVLAKLSRFYPVPFRFTVRLLLRFRRLFVKPESRPELRVVGPGAQFTQLDLKFSERVRHTADLRRQIRIRPEVHGFTRDGIEVKTSVSTIFSIGEKPDILQVTYVEGHSPENLRVIHHDDSLIKDLTDELDPADQEEIHDEFMAWENRNLLPLDRDITIPDPTPPNPFEINPYDFNEKRVFKALFPETHDVNDNKHMDWTDLPVHVAVEVFRDILMQQVYDNLYKPSKPDEFPLTIFKANFVRRLRNMGVLSYQIVLPFSGTDLKPGDQWNQDDLLFSENQELLNTKDKILRRRGIKIIHAGFSELKAVSDVIQESRYDYWSAKWEREGLETEARYDLEVSRALNFGRSKAQREMKNYFSKIFKSDPYDNEAMALRVFQALESAAADPTTRALLPDETIELLLDLRRWFLPPGDSGPDIDQIQGGGGV